MDQKQAYSNPELLKIAIEFITRHDDVIWEAVKAARAGTNMNLISTFISIQWITKLNQKVSPRNLISRNKIKLVVQLRLSLHQRKTLQMLRRNSNKLRLRTTDRSAITLLVSLIWVKLRLS